MAENGISHGAFRAKESPMGAFTEQEMLSRRILDCEEPLRELMAFSDAIAALGLVNCDKLPGGWDGRDQAVCSLSYLIWERINLIDKCLFPNGRVFAEVDHDD